MDANVAVKWLLAESGSHLAQALAEGGEEILLPDFWLNEAANVCWLQTRKGIWLEDEAGEGLALLRARVSSTPTRHLALYDVPL